MKRVPKDLYDSIKKHPLARRHLILLCQNYSISLKSWPRAPGLQGKEGERNSRRRQLPFWLVDLSISLLTRVFELLLFLYLHKVGMCLLWPVFPFMVVRSACFVLSRCGKGAAHSRSPFLFCAQWFLHTVATVSWCLSTLGGSGVPSRLALPQLWASGLRCPSNALLSEVRIGQSIWFISS